MEVPVIVPPQNFGPADHATLAQAAQVPGSKILDCTRLAVVPMNLCEVATAGWKAAPGAVPRLAIVAQIDTWALVRMMAPKPISTLAAQGTELRLFYARQLEAGHVHAWVREGKEPAHELEATLRDLDTVWRGSPVAEPVIDAVLEVIRTDTTSARGGYLATLASVALKFSGPKRSRELALEARAALGLAPRSPA